MVRQKIEESVPVQELKTSAFLSVKHFSKSVLIVLLSFFCIFIGVLIYHLSVSVETLEAAPGKEPVQTAHRVPRSPRTSVVFQHQPTPQKASETPAALVGTSEKDPASEKEPVAEKVPVIEPVFDGQSKAETPTPLPAPEPIAFKPIEPQLNLEEAMILRDHLAMGESCLEDLKIIMKKALPDRDEKDRLVEKLMPVCTVRSVYDGLEDTFYKNRKKALMTYYRLNNPLWLAYLKTFGASLVDIRKLKPSKEKPKDIMSSARNALIVKNLEQAVQEIQKLPPEIRAEFNDFIGQANVYLAAQEAAENLMLSFGRKGE